MKERYAVTELRKQANRMNFADVILKNIFNTIYLQFYLFITYKL